MKKIIYFIFLFILSSSLVNAKVRVGDLEYGNINDAINNLTENNNEIILENDYNIRRSEYSFTINKDTNVTIDLNSKSINCNFITSKKVIANSGVLIIKNGTINNDCKASNSLIYNTGDLYLENVKIDDRNTYNNNITINNDGGKAHINNSELKLVSKKDLNIYLIKSSGELLIENSVLSRDDLKTSDLRIPNSSIVVDGSTTIINNSKVYGNMYSIGVFKGNLIVNDSEFYSGIKIGNIENVNLLFNSGKIIGDKYGIFALKSENDANLKVEILAGEISGNEKALYASDLYKNDIFDVFDLKGGIYNSDISNFIQNEEYESVAKENKWTVIKKEKETTKEDNDLKTVIENENDISQKIQDNEKYNSQKVQHDEKSNVFENNNKLKPNNSKNIEIVDSQKNEIKEIDEIDIQKNINENKITTNNNQDNIEKNNFEKNSDNSKDNKIIYILSSLALITIIALIIKTKSK